MMDGSVNATCVAAAGWRAVEGMIAAFTGDASFITFTGVLARLVVGSQQRQLHGLCNARGCAT